MKSKEDFDRLQDRIELARAVEQTRTQTIHERFPDLCEEDGCGYDQVIDRENFDGSPREL